MNIDNAKELMIEFGKNGINKNSNNPRFKYVLQWQDVIGHSSMNQIVSFASSLDRNELNNFFWINNSCLDMQTSVGIMEQCLPNQLDYDKLKNENESLNYVISMKEEQINVINNLNKKRLELIESYEKEINALASELKKNQEFKMSLKDFINS